MIGPLTVTEKILLGYPLNINQLSQTELEILPGIGPSVAKKIVDYRNQKGPFRNLDSLLDIHGIGPHTVKLLTPYLSKNLSF